MLKEINLRQNYLHEQLVETIYFGGGTPSLLQINEINILLDKIFTSFNVKDSAEITLEANPDDLDTEKIKELQSAGINRLSIGVQSFDDIVLKFLERTHSAKRAEDCIKQAQDQGIINITIDYIYNIPGLVNETFFAGLQKVRELNIPHFSAYALTIEPKTLFHHQVQKKMIPWPDEDQMVEQYKLLMDFALKNNYLHYEISNFCREGWHSRHNSSYWEGKSYLGLGPSAHSFNGNSRQWNISSNHGYINALETRTSFFEIEVLNSEQKFNEYLMTSLRTMKGFDTRKVAEFEAGKFTAGFESSVKRFISSGHILQKGDFLLLSTKGKLISDHIISELFI